MIKESLIQEIREKISTDDERWKFVVKHRDIVEIILDNDETYISIGEDWIKFDESIGSMPGIFTLLETKQAGGKGSTGHHFVLKGVDMSVFIKGKQ